MGERQARFKAEGVNRGNTNTRDSSLASQIPPERPVKLVQNSLTIYFIFPSKPPVKTV